MKISFANSAVLCELCAPISPPRKKAPPERSFPSTWHFTKCIET
jgi:hypothetical protein